MGFIYPMLYTETCAISLKQAEIRVRSEYAPCYALKDFNISPTEPFGCVCHPSTGILLVKEYTSDVTEQLSAFFTVTNSPIQRRVDMKPGRDVTASYPKQTPLTPTRAYFTYLLPPTYSFKLYFIFLLPTYITASYVSFHTFNYL
jgi:hypothetical protein